MHDIVELIERYAKVSPFRLTYIISLINGGNLSKPINFMGIKRKSSINPEHLSYVTNEDTLEEVSLPLSLPRKRGIQPIHISRRLVKMPVRISQKMNLEKSVF